MKHYYIRPPYLSYMEPDLRFPLVICAFCDYEYLKDRYKDKRKVVPEIYAGNGKIYHWDRLGRFRVSKLVKTEGVK